MIFPNKTGTPTSMSFTVYAHVYVGYCVLARSGRLSSKAILRAIYWKEERYYFRNALLNRAGAFNAACAADAVHGAGGQNGHVNGYIARPLNDGNKI